MPKYYKGYILLRLRETGSEWKVVEKVRNLKSREDDEDEDWYVFYCTPIFGSWDILLEICLSKHEELDKLKTFFNIDVELSKMIEESITFISIKNNFDATKIKSQNLYYRAYVLVRLKKIGLEEEIVNKIKDLRSTEYGEDWLITYTSPIYGGWDLLVAISFSKLNELDKIITNLRSENELSTIIEETTTLVGAKQNFKG